MNASDRELFEALLAMESKAARPAFDVAALTFGPQRAFAQSTAKRRVARCSRRGGKTTGEAIILLDGALKPPYGNQGYVTLSLKNAKRLIWPTLVRLNEFYKLGGIANETEGFLRFPNLPNEPRIYLGGAKDQGEIDKLRGWEGGVKRWIIDEAQSMRQLILEDLVDSVIEPSLFDYDGELLVSGSPGPVTAGYFYDIDQGAKREGWEHHAWTMRDNPYLPKKSGKPVEQLLAELLARRGWTENNRTFRREYLGEWVSDPDALMLHYEEGRNACQFAGRQEGWTYVLGFDLGFDDADAIAVLGWAAHSKVVHLVFESVKPKQTLTPMAEDIAAAVAAYAPIAVVGDLGALGKKIGAEFATRWGLPVEAADKQRKAEHIALLDDALVTARFRAPVASRFAQDCGVMTWDAEAKAKGVLKADDRVHSDIHDATLYAFRHALAHHEQPAPEQPADEGKAALARRIEIMARRASGERTWWDDMGARVGFGGDEF